MMNILLDTNIFIPLEDNKIIDESFGNLYKLLNEYNHNIFIHPATLSDINQDKDHKRKIISKSKLIKYSLLEDIPTPSNSELSDLGLNENKINDHHDNLILFSLFKNCVNILLTEDVGIVKKARKLGIDNRVMFVQQALHSFNHLHKVIEVSYPKITKKYLYEINRNDEIFDSLKEYYKEFDTWFTKISQAQRKCWIHDFSGDKIGGILIYKDELNPIITDDDRGLSGKVLKLSTFKIADHIQGIKLGELFIKKAFNHANKNHYQYIYLTTRKDKQKYLISLIEDFGFYRYGICENNRDDVYIKEIPLDKKICTPLDKMDFHKKYSPFVRCLNNTKKFIVPIKPVYHNILFPEIEQNKRLVYIKPSAGNTIKKAYLSHANTKQMGEGDLILFYRSKDKMAITTLGIVEKAFKSTKPDAILEEVAKRTVYSYDEIVEMSKKETHIILFRLIDHFDKPFVTKEWMQRENIDKVCQSICQIDDKMFDKILKKGKLNHYIKGCIV